jgi:hypothetical protein
MAEINQLPIQESESNSDSESRILSLIEASRNSSHFSTTLIRNTSAGAESEFGYYAELSGAKDVEEFEKKIAESIRALGFDEFSYCWTANAEPDAGRLINISPHLLEDYFSEQFYEQDLILPYANATTVPVYQSTLHDYAASAPFETKVSRMMKSINSLNRSHGYYDFYNSFSNAKNGNGNVMLSVTNRGCNSVKLKELVKGSEATLQVLCEAIDFVASRKFSEALLGARSNADNLTCVTINPRPLRVLDALANNDFNIAQVAKYLSISTVTANKHLETARRAFSAKTNYCAIKQAVLNGLIDYK